MDKNTIIGLILIVLVVFGFSYYNQSETASQPATTAQTAPAKAAATVSQPADSMTAANDTTGLFGNNTQGTAQTVTLKNEKIQISLSTKGGVVSNVLLTKYKSYDDYANNRDQALNFYNEKDASLTFNIDGKEKNIRTADYVFTPTNVTDSTVTMVLGTPEKHLAIEYKLVQDYLLNCKMTAVGLANDFPSATKKMNVVWTDKIRRLEKGSYFENRYATLSYKVAEDGVEHLSQQDSEQKTEEGRVDWVAFKNQYFSAIIMAPQQFTEGTFQSDTLQNRKGYLKQYSASMKMPFDPSGKEPTLMQMYFGPNQYHLLQSQDQFKLSKNDQDLEELVDLGWPLFRWINRYFTIYVFDWLTKLGIPMGIVLLLITILLRVIVYVPTRKSFMSSAKMRVLKPKVDEIAAKYPKQEDAMKRQQEQMTLYSQYGVSPMGGCLPMLIQMPIWIAMFNFVPNAFELRQQSFFWAEDLSTYDSLITWSKEIPYLGNHLSLFCVLFVGTNLLYTYMTMRQQKDSMMGDQAQQMKIMQWMMYLMPLFFFFMFNNYSSGLNYYYFLSLLLSAGTMWYLRKTTDDAKLLAKLEANYEANKNNPAKKTSGLAARLEALQKQQEEIKKRQQEAAKRQGKK